MPFRVGDRVKENTVSTGVGGISLIGAYSGFQKFDDVLTSGDTTFYLIEENDIWEVGLGTYGSNNLERTTVLDSSSGGSKISLGGSGTVSITYPASGAAFNDGFVYVSGKIVQAVGVSGISVSKADDLVYISAAPIQDTANYASGQAVQNQVDITYVSGIAGAGGGGGDVTTAQLNYVSGIAVYSSGQAIANESDIVATSGIANYASGQAIANESDIVAVSGIAAYASGHTLQGITDNGAVTTNAISITNNNITASSGLFDSLDMTPLGNGQQPAYQEGVVFYDSENHTLTLYNDEPDIALQIGQEQYVRVRNNTGATIENGAAVLFNGVHGNSAPTVSGAIATSEASSQVIGLATHSIEPNTFGYVTTYGVVRDVDTSVFSAGDELYLSATQAGSLVNTSPVIPNFKTTIGHVIRSHDSNGSILVQVGNAKLGGGDVKSEGPLNISGVPFITSTSDTTAGGSLTDPLFIFDSGNRQLQLASGVQLLDGEPSNTSNVLYNDGGVLKFDGSAIGAGDVTTSELNYVSGIAVYASGNLYVDNDAYVSGIATYASGQAISNQSNISTNTSNISTNTSDINYVSGIAVYASGQAASTITEIPLSGLQFVKSGSSDEFRIGTTFVDPDGTEQVVRASDFNGGYLRLEVARFSPSVSANGQSRSWDQPVSQWSVTVDNPTDFTTNYVSGVKSPLTSVTDGVVTTDVTLYTTSGPSVTPDGGVDWTQTFSTDVDSPIYSSGTGLTGGSASATVSFLDKNQDTISETATISFNWSSASSSISFNSLTGNNFLQLYSSVGYNLTISNISDSSNTSTTITTGQGTLSNSSDDGTMTFTTAIHKNNNSGRTITATTDFTRPATVTGTEYTTQRVVSDSSISASFTYPSFRIFTSSTSNPPSRADIVDTNDFDSSTVTELGDQVKVLSQTVNNPESLAQCMWFGVRSSASQPTSFQTGSSASLLSDVTPTETTVNLEPDSPAAGYVAEGYNLYGITLQPGNTYVSIS